MTSTEGAKEKLFRPLGLVFYLSPNPRAYALGYFCFAPLGLLNVSHNRVSAVSFYFFIGRNA